MYIMKRYLGYASIIYFLSGCSQTTTPPQEYICFNGKVREKANVQLYQGFFPVDGENLVVETDDRLISLSYVKHDAVGSFVKKDDNVKFNLPIDRRLFTSSSIFPVSLDDIVSINGKIVNPTTQCPL